MYKTPPRYDMQLASKVRQILKYSVILHFAFGFYMYSNSSIFTFKSISYSFLKTINEYVSKTEDYIHTDYITVTRLAQTHTLLYLLGFALFIVIFLFNEVLGSMLMSCCWRCCCCTSKKEQDERLAITFSNNIYREM